MPTLQDKPTLDTSTLRRAGEEGAALVARGLEAIVAALLLAADHLRDLGHVGPRPEASETEAVLNDPQALDDLGDPELDEKSWAAMRTDLGIGSDRSHQAV